MIVLILFFADIGIGVSGELSNLQDEEFLVESEKVPAILVDGLPPLMCNYENEQLPCDTPLRLPERGDKPAAEEYGWWFGYSPDRDNNGMDDRLQRIIVGEKESVSTTAIIGEDGRKTVAIYVNYAWAPTSEDISNLKSVLIKHSWIEPTGVEGDAWFMQLNSVDTIIVDHVSVSALFDIWSLEGVVVVEMQDVYKPFLDVSAAAVKARSSEVYLESGHGAGYYGSGIVVAVLDTGVDNEHTSLNDFDDINDDPDGDATSYDDQKWVAGYDGTAFSSAVDGTEDPNDGDGHGTHVAGTAIGTGGDTNNVGVAPGSYLVDIKVLTDTGGTNNQASANGIQWMINNVNTDWGNNESSEGIQVASMSFGSFNALDTNDPGDDGNSTNSRLVNQATEAGIVCVVAIGNNGAKQVPAPASADSALVVGAVSDKGSIDRIDDEIASYSNYGPRVDDGDDNHWDELKPDVVAPGTNINAPMHAADPSVPIPGADPVLADDGYTEMTGTSMSTPHVSGMIALLLEKNWNTFWDDDEEQLNAFLVKDFVRNSTTLPDGVSATSNEANADWNEKWGFGYIDMVELFGGDVSITPPDAILIDITSPNNNSWMIENDEIRIMGEVIPTENYTYDSLTINWTASREYWTSNGWETEYKYHWDGSPELNVSEDNKWSFDVQLNNYDWYANNNWNHEIKVTAKNGNALVGLSWVIPNIGYYNIDIDKPSHHSPISGIVEFEGEFAGVEPELIEYRIDSGDWEIGTNISSNAEFPRQENGVWYFDWDSNEVIDGLHNVEVRVVNASGRIGAAQGFMYEVDNLPYAPDLDFYAETEILDGGLPVDETFLNNLLEVKVTVVNSGDAISDPVSVEVSGAGATASTILDKMEIGEIREIIIPGWAPNVLGENQEITITLDSNNELEENYVENNIEKISFNVVEYVEGVDLSLSQGAVQIRNIQEQYVIPRPNEPFLIHVAVQNLGMSNSGSASLILEQRTSQGWTVVDETSIVNVFGSGLKEYVTPFEFILSEVGGYKFRLTITNNSLDVNLENNELEFGIIVDDVQLSANVTLTLLDDEMLLGYAAVKNTGHLLTSYDGELHLRTVSSFQKLLNDVLLDDTFAGEALIYSEGDASHVVWTRRYLDNQSHLRMTISHMVIFEDGQVSQVNDLMPAIRLNQGYYFGLGISNHESKFGIAGYHRDIYSGGSYEDITSIFLLSTETPLDNNSWVLSPSVAFDIDIQSDEVEPVVIGVGNEFHILFQERRTDSTGELRLGLNYIKGQPESGIWGWGSDVGDYGSLANIKIRTNGDDDVIIAAWKEGSGQDAKLVTWVTDKSWSEEDKQITSAPGIEHIKLVETTNRGVQIYYDSVLLGSEVILYGIISDENNGKEHSLSVRLTKGTFFSADKVDDGSNFIYYNDQGLLSVRQII
ncbi:MAG: hypothetical protein CMB48_07610 [Euryarchaeota archaeon]|nr:hypothetical protein [Euryarchaeota archaeon]